MVDPTVASAQALIAAGEIANAHRLIERHLKRRPLSSAAWCQLLPLAPLAQWTVSHGHQAAINDWEPVVAVLCDPPSYVAMWQEVLAAKRADQPGTCHDRIVAARSRVVSADDATVLAFAAVFDHSLDLAIAIAGDAAAFGQPVPDFAHLAVAFARVRQHKIEEGVAALLRVADPDLRREAMLLLVGDAYNEHDLTRCKLLTLAFRPYVSDPDAERYLAQVGSVASGFAFGATQLSISEAGAHLGALYRRIYASGAPMTPVPHPVAASRPLRVGVLSESLVSNLGLVGFDQIDPAEVQFFGYCQRLASGHYRHIPLGFLKSLRGFADLNWQEAAAMIASDDLDVLLFFGNLGVPERIEVLTQRLAKRVVAFSNTFGSTGGIGIDALIFAEQLIDPRDYAQIADPVLTSRFPLKIFDSFDGHLVDPVTPPPDTIPTVGIIASEYKVNRFWIGAMAEVLRAVPAATAAIELSSPLAGGRKALRQLFAEARFPPNQMRLSFVEHRTPLRARLQKFSVVFDSSPFTGNLTSLQALSSGVPVVTVRGDTVPSRHTAALLEAIGETCLTTRSLAEQVARTIELLQDHDARAAIRQRLPGLVRASPMVDPKALGEELLRIVRAALALPAAAGG